MSFWELVRNSPEWVTALAAVIFGVVSAAIIFWQALLMRSQGKESARLLAQQNLLIRWQHEHEWIYERNRIRRELLDLTRKVSLAAGCLKGDSSGTDQTFWDDLSMATDELKRRLNALDLAVYTTPYDSWYPALSGYTDSLLEAMTKDYEFHQRYDTDSSTPVASTVKKIREITETANPTNIRLEIEASIRMDFFEFKQKWDKEFPSS